mmetsp:Transcript_8833/g.12418  ORF Transcript_8833/g.12418 Transcript_8833/m.12418 type:complete len:92 (-) Transcript_8833:306-581(-)
MIVEEKSCKFMTYQPPMLLKNGMEVSVHSCPRQLVREIKHVFHDLSIDFSKCVAILTNQKANSDLVNVGEEIEEEKDRLLNVISRLNSAGK